MKIDLSDMVLEHLVEELVMFLNNKNNETNGGPQETDKKEEPKVQELFDEPDFA